MTEDIKPINIDLIYQNINQQGGVLANKIKKILSPLQTDYIKSVKDDYIFQIKNTDTYNNINTKKDVNLRYFSEGSYTIVIQIIQSRGPENFNHKYADKLILKISDEFTEKYIKKWTEDKKKYGNHIPEIYYYGILYDNNIQKNKFGYVITREYLNYSKILNISLQNQLKFIKSFYEFIIKLTNNGQYYWDCKFQNMGCDIFDDNYIYIVLDHDGKTLVDTKTFNPTNLLTQYTYGSIKPMYVYYLEKVRPPDLKNDLLYKMYAGGSAHMLFTIINNLLTNKGSQFFLSYNILNKRQINIFNIFGSNFNNEHITQFFINILLYLDPEKFRFSQEDIDKINKLKEDIDTNIKDFNTTKNPDLIYKNQDIQKDIDIIIEDEIIKNINKILYKNEIGLGKKNIFGDKYNSERDKDYYYNHEHDLNLLKDIYFDLLNHTKFINSFNNIKGEFDENKDSDIYLSNTIIIFLIIMCLEYMNLNFAAVPDIKRITNFIDKIDILLNKINKLCAKVKELKKTYPELSEYKLVKPESLKEFYLPDTFR